MRSAPLFFIPAALALAIISPSHAQDGKPVAGLSAHNAGAPSIESFLKIRTPGSASIAADGSMYVRDWPDGVWQLYRVPADQVGASSTGQKLTDFKDGLAGYSLSPDGKTVLLFHAVGGNENTQISLLKPEGGYRPLVENPAVQYSVNLWLDDSSGFVFTGNDKSASDFYVYRYDLAAGKITQLLGKEGSWAAGDVTKDAARYLVGQYRSISDSSVYELNAASGALTDLSVKPKDGTSSNDIVGYMPGEKAVLMLTDADADLKKLVLKDLSTGAVSEPIKELAGYELDGAAIDHERRRLVVVINRDGYGELALYDLPSFKKLPLPEIPRGVVSIGDMRNGRLSWTLSNAQVPGLTYTLDKPGDQPRQITFTDTQGINLSAFPLPRLVKYTSFDGLEIPAFLWTPPGYKEGTPIPFIVNYHGGPEGQHRPTFNAITQYLLSRGYGVMQPNVRGSTGYGRTFHMMDDYKKRWDSVKDGVEAARWLVKNNDATAGKIAAYGGSYGGFMSVAVVVEDGASKDRVFGASVDVVGIVNMKTFLEKTAGYRRKLREVEYGPLSDPEFLASVSSINRIDDIKVPMMIAHGLNDPRVPVGEAMQLAVGLQQRGFDPELVFCPDEGHGFQKLSNRLLFYERMARFLDRTIGK